MEKLLTFILKLLPYDKSVHINLGGFISPLPLIYASPQWWMPLALAAIAALGKGAYDHLHPESHTIDPFDFLATVAGALPVALTLGVLNYAH